MRFFRRRNVPPAPRGDSMLNARIVSITSARGYRGWWFIEIESLSGDRRLTLSSDNLMGLTEGMEGVAIYWHEQQTDRGVAYVMTSAGARMWTD